MYPDMIPAPVQIICTAELLQYPAEHGLRLGCWLSFHEFRSAAGLSYRFKKPDRVLGFDSVVDLVVRPAVVLFLDQQGPSLSKQ